MKKGIDITELNPQKRIGNALIFIRESRGLTLSELAIKTGFSSFVLSYIERGFTALSEEQKLVICNALDIKFFLIEFLAADSRALKKEQRKKFDENLPIIKKCFEEIFGLKLDY